MNDERKQKKKQILCFDRFIDITNASVQPTITLFIIVQKCLHLQPRYIEIVSRCSIIFGNVTISTIRTKKM